MPIEEHFGDDDIDSIDAGDLRTARVLLTKALLRISAPALRKEVGKVDSTVDLDMYWEAYDRSNEAFFIQNDQDLSDFDHFGLSVSIVKSKITGTNEAYGRRNEARHCSFQFNEAFVDQALKLLDDEWVQEREELGITDKEPSPRQLLMYDAERRARQTYTERLEAQGQYRAITEIMEKLHDQCRQAMGIGNAE